MHTLNLSSIDLRKNAAPRPIMDFALLIGATLFFLNFPEVDLWAAHLFYRPEHGGFWLQDNPYIQAIYLAVRYSWVVLFVLLALWIRAWLKAGARPRRWRTALAYLMVALLLGPGLAVHGVSKTFWQRPRPQAVMEFGGEQRFVAAPIPRAPHAHGHSFGSGHAAMGFYLTAGYWISRRRHWLWIGIVAGLGIGLLRMSMGGHFLSDIVFTGLTVYLVNRWLAYGFGKFGQAPYGGRSFALKPDGR